MKRHRRVIVTDDSAVQNCPGGGPGVGCGSIHYYAGWPCQDAARAHAAGDEVRTVIAGYHWFTDWGRDTMISLEGLTLTTGR